MPEYTVNPSDIMIKFTGPEDRVVRVTDRLSESFAEKLSEREQQIFLLIEEDPGYTTSQMAEKLSISRVSIGKHIKSLKEKNIIERIGSDRKGYWKIK